MKGDVSFLAHTRKTTNNAKVTPQRARISDQPSNLTYVTLCVRSASQNEGFGGSLAGKKKHREKEKKKCRFSPLSPASTGAQQRNMERQKLEWERRTDFTYFDCVGRTMPLTASDSSNTHSTVKVEEEEASQRKQRVIVEPRGGVCESSSSTCSSSASASFDVGNLRSFI